MTIHHTKHDSVFLSDAAREAILKDIERRAAVEAACTRSPMTEAVSLDALAARYPVVAGMRSAMLAEADTLEFRAEGIASLHALTARLLWESAERLRAAVRA